MSSREIMIGFLINFLEINEGKRSYCCVLELYVGGICVCEVGGR